VGEVRGEGAHAVHRAGARKIAAKSRVRTVAACGRSFFVPAGETVQQLPVVREPGPPGAASISVSSIRSRAYASASAAHPTRSSPGSPPAAARR